MLAHALLSVVLVLSGKVDGNRAAMAAYTRHVVEDGFLARTGATATYAGELDAPALPDAEPATVQALIDTLPPGPVYLVTVPTSMQPVGHLNPYHAATWAMTGSAPDAARHRGPGHARGLPAHARDVSHRWPEVLTMLPAVAYRALIDRLPLTAALKTALCQVAAQVQAEAWSDGYARGKRGR